MKRNRNKISVFEMTPECSLVTSCSLRHGATRRIASRAIPVYRPVRTFVPPQIRDTRNPVPATPCQCSWYQAVFNISSDARLSAARDGHSQGIEWEGESISNGENCGTGLVVLLSTYSYLVNVLWRYIFRWRERFPDSSLYFRCSSGEFHFGSLTHTLLKYLHYRRIC